MCSPHIYGELSVPNNKRLRTNGSTKFQLLNPIPVTTKLRNNGFFEPFLYKDWQYPYDARNELENPPAKVRNDSRPQVNESERSPGQPLIGKIERTSEPDYLCLADRMQTVNVRKWREDHGKNVRLEYVLVSYTKDQFPSKEDKCSLHRIGQHAAQVARVKAYWVGCSCLGTDAEVEQNVWRISDIVRGAFSIIVAVAGPTASTAQNRLPHDLLREWGGRVWTLPELLLSPEHDDITVYTMNRSLDPREQLNRCLATKTQINLRNFARFWDDDSLVGQLIDHYEGSVTLSPLELMTTALQCLQNRHTTEHLPGDLSYSLMGLLRQRPNVRKNDSAFQAFARLSLANDSNMLLERLICLLPQSAHDPWYSFHDHWGASLWDIYPTAQVCGIGENDTVILDGARAASIRWKSFAPVLLRHNNTWARRLVRIALSLFGPVFIFGLFTIVLGSALSKTGLNVYKILGAILIAVISPILLSSPKLIKTL